MIKAKYLEMTNNSKIAFFLLILVSFLYKNGYSQNKDAQKSYKNLEEKLKHYKDSISLVHPPIPAVSSTLLSKGQLEVGLFNGLISANQFRNSEKKLIDLSARQTYYYGLLQLTYGTSKSARLNMGIDINFNAARIDSDPKSSPLAVFGSNTNEFDRSAKAIGAVGPRIRWRPFKKSYRFTVQSSVWFPTVGSPSKQQFLGISRVYWITQLLYNQPVGKSWFLFSQLALQYGFQNKANTSSQAVTPATAYVCYLIPKKTVLFALLNYTPVIDINQGLAVIAQASQYGFGIQYQFSKHCLINTFYSDYFAGRNYADYKGYNMGLRMLF